jgi:transketolase
MATTPVQTHDWRAQAANQTRLAFGQALLEVAARDPKAVVLSADTQDLLGIRPYMARYPERFVEVGIAEQNAIGIASGLATTGLHAYVCGYAPFISARSMEQVRNDVAYAHQRVVIGAAASGISLGVSGGTHHALEDLALMRSLPHMTVIVPADVDEAYQATLATLDIDGPAYIRLGGCVEEPPVTDPTVPFRLGQATELRAGSDITVIACGCMVEMAVRASWTLASEGIGVRVLNMHTIKPLDREAILRAALSRLRSTT